jgi:hypothetical protein
MEFVERCSTVTAEEATRDFLDRIRQFGFTGAACGAWAGVGRNRKVRFFFVDWPQDWLNSTSATEPPSMTCCSSKRAGA